MSVLDLPSTFQDAVRITKSLQVRYLWIDSLCIIQDDFSDWEREASLMGNVYANSFLTIAASSSTDDSSGCLLSIDVRQNSPHVSADAISMRASTPAADVPPYIVDLPGQEPGYLARQEFLVVKTNEPDTRTSQLIITKEWMPSSNKSDPIEYKIDCFGSTFDPLGREPLTHERGLFKNVC